MNKRLGLHTARIEVLESRIAPANLVLTTLADNGSAGSLRSEIATLNTSGGGTITLAKGLHGAIVLKSDGPDIFSSIGLDLPNVTINGAGKYRDLSITGGASVALTGMTLTGGVAANGGGLYINTSGTTVTLTSCVFEGNKATNGGGLFVSDPGAAVRLLSSVVKGNKAAGSSGPGAPGGNAIGGGIDTDAGNLVLNNSKVTGNAAVGGAGALYKNGGNAYGGGVYNKGGGITVFDSTVSGNTASGGRGGAGINFTSHVAATGGASGGTASGGGIDSVDGLTGQSISGSVISGNAARGGSGGNGGKADPRGAGTYGGNAGGATGGGVFILGSSNPSANSASISTSTISGNIAAGGNGGAGSRGNGKTGSAGKYAYAGSNASGDGGGISYESGGTLSITASTISGNKAAVGLENKHAELSGAGEGGGIIEVFGNLKLSLVTLGNNSSSNLGGGLYVSATSTSSPNSISIHNCTIAANKSATGGGLYDGYSTAGQFSLVSTIISGNTAKTDPDVGLSPASLFNPATQITASYDLIGNINLSTQANVVASHDLLNVSPMLGPLGYHDHGHEQTFLPSARSPAVLGGPGQNVDGLGTDENGQLFGTSVDIGAVQTTK